MFWRLSYSSSYVLLVVSYLNMEHQRMSEDKNKPWQNLQKILKLYIPDFCVNALWYNNYILKINLQVEGRVGLYKLFIQIVLIKTFQPFGKDSSLVS